MKRAKQVEKMIERCNEYLKNNRIHDENDDVFIVMTSMLIAAKCYDGYQICHAELGSKDKRYLRFF